MGDAAFERRSAARAVVHLFVDALGEHGVLIDALRRELVLDDRGDDRRGAESGTNAGEPVVGFDPDQGRITLDLGSKVGAVTLFLRNGCRHRNGRHFDDFHGWFFPGQSILSSRPPSGAADPVSMKRSIFHTLSLRAKRSNLGPLNPLAFEIASSPAAPRNDSLSRRVSVWIWPISI
jgi:hypothetical protein